MRALFEEQDSLFELVNEASLLLFKVYLPTVSVQEATGVYIYWTLK